MIFVPVLFGCKPNVNSEVKSLISGNSKPITINIDEIKIEESLSMSTLFNGFDIIPLETKKECLIGKIRQIQIHKDLVYVLDATVARGLFLFDSKGTFIKRIGVVGNGPGEYLEPISFTISNDAGGSIMILDSHRNKIIRYSMTGLYMCELGIEVGCSPIQISSVGGQIFVDQLRDKSCQDDYLLCMLNNNGEITQRYLSYEKDQKGFSQSFNVGLNMFKFNNVVKYTKPFFDTVYEISSNGEINSSLVLHTKNHFTKEEIDVFNSFNGVDQVIKHYRECKRFMGIDNYVENEDVVHLKFKNNYNTHNVFFWKKSKIASCCFKIEDDLTYLNYPIQFLNAGDNYFMACVQNIYDDEIGELVNNVKSGKVVVSDDLKSNISGLNDNSNPIIVKYYTKGVQGF